MERLTLIGLYNYDNSLFDSCTLPTGIDKDLTIDCILNRGGQFETIYPDFDYLKYSMGKWFERHYRTFDKWITALNIEYDPLNNYDRYEESVDNRAYSDNESGAHNQTNNHNQFNSHNQNNSHVEDNSHNEAGSSNINESSSNSQKANSSSATNGATAGTQGNTVTNTVSAFDSGNFQNKDQQTSNGSDSSTTSGNTVTNNLTDENGERQNTSNDVRNSNDNIKSDDNIKSNDSIKSNESLSGNNQINKNGIDKNQHTAHLYGNIGVTTSQQMLQSELDIARFNIYNEIAELFIEDFCILVY